MRGKGPPVADMWKRSGITPAYAGKRGTPKGCVEHCGDHPRLCGEKETFSHSPLFLRGSPPPMRGKGLELDFYKSGNWITPAYAGKRSRSSNLPTFSQDHPRLCGEKSAAVCVSNFHSGSPPPMRGKAEKSTLWEKHKGITPAYAGKSEPSGFMLPTSQDHPRLCGEKSDTLDF